MSVQEAIERMRADIARDGDLSAAVDSPDLAVVLAELERLQADAERKLDRIAELEALTDTKITGCTVIEYDPVTGEECRTEWVADNDGNPEIVIGKHDHE